MQRWNDLTEVPDGFGPCVVTLGNFDGVHGGHRVVLGRVVEAARAVDAPAVAVTFDPHPLRVLFPDRAPELITGLDQRLALIASTGIDAVLVMEFTPDLASWSPERFVTEVFVGALHASAIVVGHDTRFGKSNSGDAGTLAELGAAGGFVVEVVDDLVPDAAPRRSSSSWARELLHEGDVSGAAVLLGRPHRLTGEVVHGDHRGRELGYPTANLEQDVEGMVPADGVYAGWMLRTALPEDHPDRLLPAAVSIGTNPTFSGTRRQVEAHVIDRIDLDLYGESVSLEMVSRLRGIVRFDSADELVVQMAKDVDQARDLLARGIVPRVT